LPIGAYGKYYNSRINFFVVTKTQYIMNTVLNLISEKIEKDMTSPLNDFFYCTEQNLTINSSSGSPAVIESNLGTRTETRVDGEDSDSDSDIRMNSIQLGTKTVTLIGSEGTDTDSDFHQIRYLFGTKTISEVNQEITDSDK
jgi:hypothetical protein